ncbi:XRE family transcriptional regulator [Streptococcus chenjunshii]|uniref:XRE family transcriptional regulator n=1 Tax=Streptococcus chenjunshii TaxID=2173853 RepID=A0A372KJP3_9STRE|nr:helix-turn-helix transcriptional regulator [Streptococcus chenjunshii]AXQ77606.1 XRE family transcriptional regulator [Streptococcus chenjunshii]RFU50283.1 XRE family transcriptional regulator [Streptococcus chenjunshii]RFU52495.1 XRE family transcriptional regulator [Streptococcus chenjunshii]
MLLFPNQLKKYRTERGMSQEELANKLFISRQAVSKWEKDEAKPDLDNVVKLSEIFDISLDELILGKESTVQPVYESEFLSNPNTGTYEKQRKPKIENFYDFVAHF